jgi:valyl-tRNA synthetase
MKLAYAGQVTIAKEPPDSADGMVTAVTHEARMFIPLSELVDLEKEKHRIEKERDKSRAELDALMVKLGNPALPERHPPTSYPQNGARGRLSALIEKLEEQLKSM